MDFNINNYSCDELVNMLNIDKNNMNLSSINNAITESMKKTEQEEKKQHIIDFLLKAHSKICNDLDIQVPSYTTIELKTLSNKILNNTHDSNDFLVKYKEKPRKTTSLNPLLRQTFTNVLTINSKYRRDYFQTSATDFMIDLPEPFKNVISIKFSAGEIQNAYYAFSKQRNSNRFIIIRYEEDITNPAFTQNRVEQTIEIHVGNFTATQMVTEINKHLDANSAVGSSTNFIETNYNPNTGLFTFRKKTAAVVPPPPAGFVYKFELQFYLPDLPSDRDLALNMGWMLGYYKDLYKYDTDYQEVETSTAEVGFNPNAPVDFTGSRFFFLELDDYNKNYPQTLFYPQAYHSFNMHNVIAKIPNVVGMNAIIFEDSSDREFKKRVYYGPVDIKRLHIRIMDEHGEVISFNDCDLTLTFELTLLNVHYKEYTE